LKRIYNIRTIYPGSLHVLLGNVVVITNKQPCQESWFDTNNTNPLN
jgi:hypothetical protein